MIQVLLTQVKTHDGIMLDGIYVPSERRSKTALIWLHGLGSRFYSGQPLIKELSGVCRKNGIGYFKFNTRGHDIVARDGTLNPELNGAAYEKFPECIRDIRAQVRLAKNYGYKNIILAGHSTGANKALYYVYKTRDRNIKGLVLAGPISDIPAEEKRIGRKSSKIALSIAEKLYKKDPSALMPEKFGIYSAKRYLSLYRAGSAEDVFPYHNPHAQWKELRSVRIPTAMVIGAKDEYLDRPAPELTGIFRKNTAHARSFSGIIIKGADHGFHKKEKELTREIIKWIKDIRLN